MQALPYMNSLNEKSMSSGSSESDYQDNTEEVKQMNKTPNARGKGLSMSNNRSESPNFGDTPNYYDKAFKEEESFKTSSSYIAEEKSSE